MPTTAMVNGTVNDLAMCGARQDFISAGEIAETAGLAIEIGEQSVPVREDVGSACELLGLDPFHIANEGRFLVFVPAGQAGGVIEILCRHPISAGARVIGAVAAGPAGQVTCRSVLGGKRVVDMLSGEQLSRIC